MCQRNKQRQYFCGKEDTKQISPISKRSMDRQRMMEAGLAFAQSRAHWLERTLHCRQNFFWSLNKYIQNNNNNNNNNNIIINNNNNNNIIIIIIIIIIINIIITSFFFFSKTNTVNSKQSPLPNLLRIGQNGLDGVHAAKVVGRDGQRPSVPAPSETIQERKKKKRINCQKMSERSKKKITNSLLLPLLRCCYC